MDFLKNIIINLKATGVSAVMCVWILAVMMLGMVGNPTLGDRALTILMIVGIAFLGGLAQNTMPTLPATQKPSLPPKKDSVQNANQIEDGNSKKNIEIGRS
jgi:NADH:ubiquinone oxidoreductase subunit 6 (subunit J)